jgi:GNAT superfamily N-acetyltransferase
MRVVTLRPYGDGDRGLALALESDPAVKRDLGGPIGAAEAERIHDDRLTRMAGGELFYTIGVAQEKAGIAAVLRTPWAGGVIHEAGVMLLPGRAGQGVGREALRLLRERARDELGRFTMAHAVWESPDSRAALHRRRALTDSPRTPGVRVPAYSTATDCSRIPTAAAE